jgi:AcrR family transcriptional regulator
MAAGIAGSDTARPSARERLLASANELFYDEGIQTVGIDRVIEHAGVAKASLYNTFGSKEELIRAYLDARRESLATRITANVERFTTPRDRLLGVFDAQHAIITDSEYRGCAFARASAEARPGSCVMDAAKAYRAWIRSLFARLADEAGVPDPDALARQLHLLYDGAGQAARMDGDLSASLEARASAELLLDAALAGGGAR